MNLIKHKILNNNQTMKLADQVQTIKLSLNNLKLKKESLLLLINQLLNHNK